MKKKYSPQYFHYFIIKIIAMSIDWSPSMLTYESPVYIKMVTPVSSIWSNQTMDIGYAQSILSCKRRLDHEFSLEGDVIDDNEYDERNNANKYVKADGSIYILEEGVRRSKRKMESMAKPRYFSHLKIEEDNIKHREMMMSDEKSAKLILRLKIPKKM